jgi:hypothetical protein
VPSFHYLSRSVVTYGWRESTTSRGDSLKWVVTEGSCVAFAVSVNGQVLEIEDSATKSTKRSIKLEDGSSLEVEWQLYASEIGPYVLIRSGVIATSLAMARCSGTLVPLTTLLHFGMITSH